MSLVTDSRDFINNHGGPSETKKHVMGLFENDNFKMHELYPKLLRTGNMYTFKYYDRTLRFELSKRRIPYGDLHPFGILLSVDGETIRMLNLNVIPLRVRERLFSVIFKLQHFTIDKNINNNNPNSWLRIPITEDLIKKYIPYDLSIAVNIYNIKNIRKIHAIGWGNVPQVLSLYFDKTVYYNRSAGITKHTINRKIILNKRNEKIIK